jgi:hypothetical protein
VCEILYVSEQAMRNNSYAAKDYLYLFATFVHVVSFPEFRLHPASTTQSSILSDQIISLYECQNLMRYHLWSFFEVEFIPLQSYNPVLLSYPKTF